MTGWVLTGQDLNVAVWMDIALSPCLFFREALSKHPCWAKDPPLVNSPSILPSTMSIEVISLYAGSRLHPEKLLRMWYRKHTKGHKVWLLSSVRCLAEENWNKDVSQALTPSSEGFLRQQLWEPSFPRPSPPDMSGSRNRRDLHTFAQCLYPAQNREPLSWGNLCSESTTVFPTKDSLPSL